MAIEGTLQEMDLATVLQMVSQRGSGPTCILLQHDQERAVLYLEGQIVSHVEMASQTETGLQTQMGEEVFYRLLTWHSGNFSVKQNIRPLHATMEQSWNFLLMEGLRRIDEAGQSANHVEVREEDPAEILDMLSTLSADDAQAIRELIALHRPDNDVAEKKQQVTIILKELIEGTADIVGAAVADNDGLLLANQLSDSINPDKIASISATLLNLSDSSSQQLNFGSVYRTIIQAETGNIVAVRVTPNALLVGLTTADMNLGLAIVKSQQAASAIAEIM
jgi:uncharacterized protein